MNQKLKKLHHKVKDMHFSMRWAIGFALILGGVFWVLPILGLWMIPLGLLVLAPDFKWARRGYLSTVKLVRRFQQRMKSKK